MAVDISLDLDAVPCTTKKVLTVHYVMNVTRKHDVIRLSHVWFVFQLSTLTPQKLICYLFLQ